MHTVVSPDTPLRSWDDLSVTCHRSSGRPPIYAKANTDHGKVNQLVSTKADLHRQDWLSTGHARRPSSQSTIPLRTAPSTAVLDPPLSVRYWTWLRQLFGFGTNSWLFGKLSVTVSHDHVPCSVYFTALLALCWLLSFHCQPFQTSATTRVQ